MTKPILFLILFICLAINAQQKNTNQSQQNKTMPMYPKIYYSYDTEGNQTERIFRWSSSAKAANSKPKETLTSKEALQNASSFDAISYYPNPVKDNLNLEWESRQDNPVASINVFGLNGQLLESYSNNTKTNAQKLSFHNYPSGVYAVVLLYSNGKQKSIKIIKQ